MAADTHVALPHASLLAYFRNPAAAFEARDSGRLSETDSEDSKTHQLLAHQDKDATSEDEEWQCGFWGERLKDSYEPSHRDSLTKGATAFWCFWSAISIFMLAAIGLYFVVDLTFSYYGMGTGMSQWVLYRHQLPPSTSYSMEFCLQAPNREPPRPRLWRYMVPGSDKVCATDSIEFIVNPRVAWKVRPDDVLVVGDDVPHRDAHILARDPATAQVRIRAYELGDDLAEEGDLGRSM
ncbi:hypothetical protein BDW02DRAFT_574737 [Decorospora gaudefroyi]|uniref:Uncharacterized protein n=1 Tax=Decorospora gaudefroyi TaxID=184978 RepID=A0A6A5JY80_9PLEO|nr:hypothetical protein BDW02DRAFT_574737 [Decorospora gaudefroyi]